MLDTIYYSWLLCDLEDIMALQNPRDMLGDSTPLKNAVSNPVT